MALVDEIPASARSRSAAARSDAAKRVFAEAGYHGASINAIIERAQIARGTFYLYFESKAAVFDSILDEAMRDLRARHPPHRGRDAERAAAAGPAARAGRRDARVHRPRSPARDAAAVGRPHARRRGGRAPRPVLRRGPRLARARDGVGHGDRPVAQGPPELAAAAMLGMFRGVDRAAHHADRGSAAVETVVAEVLMVALRGVLK